jgi:hypothetical protein
MKLIFQNSRNEERVIAECSTIGEVHKEIDKFLKEHNFKSYYTRVIQDWINPDRIRLDVGSWTEFFFVEGATFKDFQKYNDELLNKKGE